MLNQETTFVVSFVNHNQYQKGEQHDQARKHRADRSYNTVSVVASAVLLGLQVTRLIKSPKEDSSVDDSEE